MLTKRIVMFRKNPLFTLSDHYILFHIIFSYWQPTQSSSKIPSSCTTVPKAFYNTNRSISSVENEAEINQYDFAEFGSSLSIWESKFSCILVSIACIFWRLLRVYGHYFPLCWHFCFEWSCFYIADVAAIGAWGASVGLVSFLLVYIIQPQTSFSSNFDCPIKTKMDPGAVYIFEYKMNDIPTSQYEWKFIQKLTPSNSNGDKVGHSVSLYGKFIHNCHFQLSSSISQYISILFCVCM